MPHWSSFISQYTRPDVTYVVQQLSQFVTNPYSTHWEAAIHVLRYLKGTLSFEIFYLVCYSLSLQAYSDADWATCKDTRRSITGFLCFVGIFSYFMEE